MQDSYKTIYVTNAKGEVDINLYINRAKRLRAEATADLLARLLERLKLGRAKRDRRLQLRTIFN